MRAVILVATMAIVTILLRFLPFWVFKGKTPRYISYLGEVLPSAIIGMLVVYCLKDVSVMSAPYGIPEAVAGLTVVGLQIWKRDSLISILSGTVIYMIMMHII